ncbi:MAG: NAD-dependent epimerase/dehydratase family protein [Candidatus Omnitrophica bacterium]|nr:NAD-dependent epimerase/dehydratase family protein [Candidatus Omnitrophota bacterium]
MDKNTRILITGATGFIGRSLVKELCAKGYTDITAMVRRTSNAGFLKENDINTLLGDISDQNSLSIIKGKYDVLFHCAGFISDSNEKRLEDVNIRGTENVCNWAFEHKIKKFIYLSSIAVNSGNPEAPLREDMPYKATNKYGISKLEAEKVAVGFRDRGLPMVIVRPCMVYGEGEPHMLPLLARLIKLRLLILPNQGKPKLHLVSVRNVAACLVHCMEDVRALGGTFHIADNEVLTVGEIFNIFAKSLGVSKPLHLSYSATKFFTLIPFIGKRIKFLCKDRVYSIERLKTGLDFIPPYPVYSELAASVKK